MIHFALHVFPHIIQICSHSKNMILRPFQVNIDNKSIDMELTIPVLLKFINFRGCIDTKLSLVLKMTIDIKYNRRSKLEKQHSEV